MNGLSTLWGSLQGSLGANLPQVLGALLIFVIGWVRQRPPCPPQRHPCAGV